MQKEKLEKLLKLVIEISKMQDNQWFKNQLLELLGEKLDTSLFIEVKNDTSKIVDYLSISPECSIDYSFIKYELLRKRLELDNLRMENIRYNLQEKDEIRRLYDYIMNAFYQVENLLNYYYFKKFPDFESLIYHLENIPNTRFRKKDEKNVAEIAIAVKIFSFNSTFYTGRDFTGYNIDSLRLIRNEGSHRATIIKKIENENKRLHDFLTHATFDSIHALVNNLAIKIKENLI